MCARRRECVCTAHRAHTDYIFLDLFCFKIKLKKVDNFGGGGGMVCKQCIVLLVAHNGQMQHGSTFFNFPKKKYYLFSQLCTYQVISVFHWKVLLHRCLHSCH